MNIGFMHGYNDLIKLINHRDSTLFGLYDGDKPVGCIGLNLFKSVLSNDKIANEHYWFVSKDYRNGKALRLLRAASNWAKENGCSHLILNASYLASDLAERTCKIYERMGLKKFEVSYIQEL